MMQRIVTILDTALTVNYNDRPISTQKDLDTYKFQFDDSWLGYVKTAVFYTDPAMVKHLLIPEDGVVTIPWEILTGKPQVLYIGVFGTKDTKVKPTTFGAVRLREGSYIDGVAPLPPTPDVYQQIISAWEGAKTEEEVRVTNENSRRNNFDALVVEYNALKAELEQEITDGTVLVDALQGLEADYAAKALTLETTYTPRLGSVESQLAETVIKADTATTKANAMASGSPKGVYATLALLQTAYPTGTTGAYLVTADGKWYYYNAGWLPGGTYQTTGIVDGSITQRKMVKPYLTAIKGKNLFDKTIVTDGKYINSGNGALSTSAAYSASDYILLAPNTTYKISGTNEQFALYDASKVYTRGLTITANAFTTSATETYIRISMLTTQKDVVQVELGSVATVFESYDTVYFDESLIKTRISKEKLDDTFVLGTSSSNLFNKYTATVDKYINQGNGWISASVGSSASDYIEILPTIRYCIALYSTGAQGAWYDSNKVYISGVIFTTTVKSYVAPANAKYFRFSFLTTDLALQKMELGSVATSYEPYGSNFVGYDAITNDAKNKLAKKPISLTKVSPDGNSDYTTISAAVLNTLDGNMIEVMPGVYDEIVKAFVRDLSIIGVDKKRCILKNTNGDYATPPLEMTHGHLANMTIISEKLEGATAPANLSYAIHIDNAQCANKKFLVENCDIISDWNSPVGIGLWTGYELTFKNCDFYCRNASQLNGAVFFHNSSVAGAVNQKIKFDNCRIISKSGVAMNIMDVSQNAGIDTTMVLYNTLVYSETTGKNGITKTNGTAFAGNHIELSADSFGNNIDSLNL